jgi:signal transduction histidine kinase
VNESNVAGSARAGDITDSREAYGATLADYLRTHDEAALYRASLLSQQLVEAGLGPEEIIELHFESLERVQAPQSARERVHSSQDAYQFLLEVMIAYGVQYKRYVELRLLELSREAEQRVAAEQARLREATETAQRQSDLLGIVAHELRTPLTAAKGNVDMAQRSLQRGQVDRLGELLSSAGEAMDRLSRLTGDLVEASRGTPPTLERTPQDLVHLIAQACRWARAAAVSKGIALEWAREPLGVLVLGDADALLSVFGNLLSNAIRYTSPGGLVEVRHGADAGWVWVEVRDTGVGMAEEVRRRIFEKFYRSDEAKRLGRGLGLGLALVDQFVEAHAGRVEVESTPGKGSTFRVFLPEAKPPSPPPAAPRQTIGTAEAPPPGSGSVVPFS